MPFLERLGLHRPELRAWAMCDWANSAFMTTIVGSVFPIYYAQVAAATLDPNTAAFRFSIATTIALALVTVLSPILGTIADFAPVKKKFLARLRAIGAGATGAMFLIQRGDWALALTLLALGNIGAMASLIFYDSLLPHIAQRRRARSRVDGRLRDRLSRRRPAARHQSGVDSVSRGRSGCPTRGAGVAPVVPERGDLVGGVFDSAVPRACRSRPVRLAQAMPLSRAIGASFVELGGTPSRS